MAHSDSEEEEEENVLTDLYAKASTKKAALTRAKKALNHAIVALSEAPASEYFFSELTQAVTKYRSQREIVLELYDTISSQVDEEKFRKDFGKQSSEIEKDYDQIEDQVRRAVAAHQDALATAAGGRAPRAQGAEGGRQDPESRWKLESSFQPKVPLKVDSKIDDFNCWLREFQSYYDMSNLKKAEMHIQRAVLLNCLHPDFQTKIYEAMSAVTTIKAGLELVKHEFQKKHPEILRRHQLFCLEQSKDEYNFSDTITRMLTLAKDANLVDLTRDQILCHILLKACTRDEELRSKLLEVDSATMTLDKLTKIVERYELIQLTNHGLSKKEKVTGRRVEGKEGGNLCFKCQDPNASHFARSCPVDPKSLYCEHCASRGLKAPHSHNTFPTCGQKVKENTKKQKKKKVKKDSAKSKKVEAKEEHSDEEESKSIKGNRVRVRETSPAGEPESSSSDEDDARSRVRRVYVQEQVECRQKQVGSRKEKPPDLAPSTHEFDSNSSEKEDSHTLVTKSYCPSQYRGRSPGPVCVPIKKHDKNLTVPISQLGQAAAKVEAGSTEEEFHDAEVCSSCPSCLPEEESEGCSMDECSPLPPMVRMLNCAHRECREDCQMAEEDGEEEAFARKCRHVEVCSQGLKKFTDTPPMPVQLAMKPSQMTRSGSWVISCPDTGASASILKESVAKSCRLQWAKSKVTLTSATGQAMKVSGEAHIFAKVKKGHTKKIRVIISPDLEDNCLISWSDQVLLGVISEKWPECLPDKMCDDEDMGNDEEGKCRGVRSEEEDAEFPQEWPQELRSLLSEFKSVFSDTLTSDMRLKDGEFDLKLLPGATPYQTNRVQRLNYHERAATNQELQKMLDGKVLRKYDPTNPDQASPWMFTAQWIPKPNRPGQYRLCTDLDELNKRIEKDVYHFDSPKELWRKVEANSRWFISLDCQSAFHQLEATKEASRILTIALPQGQFQYLTGPQGCSNTGSAFCRYSDKILEGTKAIKGVDDILLAAPTLQELLVQLRQVLEKAKAGNLTFSKKKVDFGHEVEFCGQLVGEDGVKPSPRKIQTIKDLKAPTDESSLRSILGLCQQFSHYHPDLSQTCLPLRELLKKGNIWHWGDVEEKAFQSLKDMMTKEMMAVSYDPVLPTRLLTDSSEMGVGYLLAQWHQEAECHCKKKVCKCKWKILWANSTTLKKSYKGVPPIYLEAIGVRWAVQDAAFYLKGLRNPFEIVTDHVALLGLSRKELVDVPEKLRDIFMFLRPYHCFWSHIPGSKHLMADCLSRLPNTADRSWVASPTTAEMDAEFCRSIPVRKVKATDSDYVWHDPSLEEIIVQAGLDKEYKELLRLVEERRDKAYIKNSLPTDHIARSYLPVWDKLGVIESDTGEEKLITCDVSRLVIPKGVDDQGNCDGHLRKHILDLLHVPHLGVVKSCKAAAQHYHWPNMHQEVAQRCQDCQTCEANMKKNKEEPPVPKHDLAAYAMEFVGSDLFHFDGNIYLIVVDFFSGYPLVKNLGKTSSTAKIIKRMTKWFNLLGYPRKCRADGGGEYRLAFQQWCRQAGIKFEVSSPFHPQSNCRAEATLGHIKALLRKCKEANEDFETALAEWRNCPRADGPSCSELFFSRQVRSAVLPQLLREVQVEQNRADRREQEIAGRVKRSTHLPLPPFQKGDQVLMLDKKDKWTIPAVVRDIRPNGKSYVVETATSVYLRNRKYLKLHKSLKSSEVGAGKSEAGNMTPPDKQSLLQQLGQPNNATQPSKPSLEVSRGSRSRREPSAAAAPRGPVLTRARARQQNASAAAQEFSD